ncbi:unnamed protein product [Diatraea saccharalis]|uniref:CHK kinase-like domain-containing protein n=1 Tax=Diatraea saccharalis TaxID=40085 RepID=A0A9N9WIF7_9NEOP|nr:unnamed protein product [Diatraea saccharalis]
MADSDSCRSNHIRHSIHIDGNISPTVEKSIMRIVEKEGFLEYTLDIRNISTNGGNYLANLQEIDVKGKTECGEKEIDLFVKNKLQTDSVPLPLDEAYEREAFYYNELVEIYDKLQEEAKVPVEERLEIAKSYKESNSDTTILENLTKKGFKTCSRLQPISQEFAEISIKQLAKFHALSFALKIRRPEYFESKIKTLNNFMRIDTEMEDYIDKICSTAASSLNNIDHKKRLEKFSTKMIDHYKTLINPPDGLATCLCHGDFRSNNIMILETEGAIDKLIPVDYQLINYGCPVIDFLYLVFTGSDQKLRRDHLDDLKDLYYKTFENFLVHFDVRAQDVYSRERFEKEYWNFLNHGLCSFLIIAPFLFCCDDEIPDLNNGITTINLNFNSPTCKERLCALVDDFVQWGCL